MKLELDLDLIKRLGKEREDENFDFRAFLKGQDSDKVDEIVHRLHDEIFARIDCTEYGNCCNFLRPIITEKEIDRLSKIDKISAKDFEKKFVELDEFDKTKYLKDAPCKYLKDKKCTIYAERPEECRSYPYTHKDGFIFRLFGVIDNYEICPIVFNLYERLKMELGFR
ncbi:MAG: YkgJ family cysteine cluster protein [Bacteroidales bacterium]